MNRRDFLMASALAGGGAITATRSIAAINAAETFDTPQFRTQDAAWQAAYDKALQVLTGNVQTLPRYAKPVLIEGAAYQGIWMECGPHESLVYRKFRPDIARQSHQIFFALQKPDGQIPYSNKVSGTGFGQIQMTVPIAATAWELAEATGDDALLHEAYEACVKWDAWLLKYRNLRGTGLTEGFCTYDTGEDNSPRWQDIPPQCPDQDARKFVPGLGLPRLCPDLSATTYGARVALAKMAAALGKSSEAARWQQQADAIRGLILKHLYDAKDAAFYDVDAAGKFVKIRCDILSRVCGEHVVDQPTFETLWSRQLHEPKAFWAPLPLPSVALDDPLFVRPIPQNSWGGASQALTALRTSRWFDAYGKYAAHAELMQRWCAALMRDGKFGQQADPLNAQFTAGQPTGYSPAALVMMDFTWRLAGISESGRNLNWNIRPDHAASRGAHFNLRTDTKHRAQMTYDAHGAELKLDGRLLARVNGGAARLVTGESGELVKLVSIDAQEQSLRLMLPDAAPRRVTLNADAEHGLSL